MKFALYAPNKTCKKGSIRFAFTGAEIKHLYNQYKPHHNSRATVHCENNSRILRIKFDPAGTYKLSTIETVFSSHKEQLDNATVAQFQVTKLADYGFKAPKDAITADLEGKWHGSHNYVIEIPERFFEHEKPSTPVLNAKDAPLLPEIKQSIANLNALLEKAEKWGWDLDIRLENKRITGKAQKKQEFDF